MNEGRGGKELHSEDVDDRPSACCSTKKMASSETMNLCRRTMLGTQRGTMVFLFRHSLLFLRP